MASFTFSSTLRPKSSNPLPRCSFIDFLPALHCQYRRPGGVKAIKLGAPVPRKLLSNGAVAPRYPSDLRLNTSPCRKSCSKDQASKSAAFMDFIGFLLASAQNMWRGKISNGSSEIPPTAFLAFFIVDSSHPGGLPGCQPLAQRAGSRSCLG